MEEGCLLNLIRALNFATLTKEKAIIKEIILYIAGFWLTRRLCGWWGQSLGNQARDCGCFFMQQRVFAQEFHHLLPGMAADHRVMWFHCRGEKMSFLCKITFSTIALLDMKVNKCLNYSK